MTHLTNASRLSILIFTLLLCSPVLAQTVSTSVEISVGAATTSDVQGPANTSLSSFLDSPDAFTIDFSGNGFGLATQQVDGVSAVYVEGLFANGGTLNSMESRTMWSDSATNNTGAVANYQFEYFITPAQLRIVEFAFLDASSTQAPRLSFEVVIRSNGAVLFHSSALLQGGRISHTLTETGTSLNPVVSPNPLPEFTSPTYNFAPRTDTLDLGLLAPGETVTVEYELTASLITEGLEAGGIASIGDPFDLTGTPGVTGRLLENGVVPTQSSSWGRIKALYE